MFTIDTFNQGSPLGEKSGLGLYRHREEVDQIRTVRSYPVDAPTAIVPPSGEIATA
jgi:hypothetical protein